MTGDTVTFTWAFGGPLGSLPPLVAGAILGTLAVAGVVFVAWSYTRGLVQLTPPRRALLCALRAAVWLGLLVLLAAPTRIQRHFDQPPPNRPLAVLVDRSGSMVTPDNRDQRRVDDALRRWQPLEPAARASHPQVKTFAFSTTVKPARLGESAPGLPTSGTTFFQSLQDVIRAAPAGGWDAVVTLTDGLDTTAANPEQGVEAVTRAATEAGTALYFLPGRNRYAGTPFAGLRDVRVPTRVAPHAKIHLEAVIDSYQTAPRELPIQLLVNGAPAKTTALALPAGRRLLRWSAQVEAPATGNVGLVLRAGDDTVRAEVQVARAATNRILYYQGALDWSYRFLADILNRDSAFALTPVFNFPNPHAVLPPGALRRMPDIPKELDDYDIVVLANASALQFTTPQQAALSRWVRDGGVVVFFTPDDDSTQGFIGSELEKMLPVFFAPAVPRSGRTARALAAWRAPAGAAAETSLPRFAWETTPRVREIFPDPDHPLPAPEFLEYAHVAAAKPGADVLARHPTELAPGGENAILLAIQRYGSGQSAVLTTDALWRWRLNEPAGSHQPDIFWRTLFAWLTRQRDTGLHFEQTPRLAALGESVSVNVAGARAGRLVIEASLGARQETLRGPDTAESVRTFAWTPAAAGMWQLTARDDHGNESRHWVTVKEHGPRGELSGEPPDEELLRSLAARTGGEVLEQTAPAAWLPVPRTGILLGERRQALWHQPWVFAVLLGMYGADLLLRRRWRML